MNSQFGFMVKPIPMFIATNIEFGWVLKPKSWFIGGNIEFGCGGSGGRTQNVVSTALR